MKNHRKITRMLKDQIFTGLMEDKNGNTVDWTDNAD